ncbi:NADH-quinone oxidoreductase subunit N [Halomarina ordinaria]|uniref:NADH-quinone oxidoreductase subunit N n=1 Tax=Halomarina ordinaria TaxID=3033939 RepID=A0ABD5U9G5_9EURY|nr:NADH-quinone oxidoreductase subunit N [Halomarina sp. PSRA2]
MIPLQTTGTELAGLTMLAPSLVLGVAALVLFLVDSIDPGQASRGVLSGIATVGSLGALLAAGVVLLLTGGESTVLYGGQLVVDGMSLFFTFIFASVTALVSLASYDYLRDDPHQAEYYSLMLLAATGMTLMAASNSFATVFVSLELASLPSYVLVAYLKSNRGSVEAGMKYFLIGALSSAVFAYGISLVYGVTGSLLLPEVADALSGGVDDGLVGVLGVGVVMVIGGFAFKTASVPFHFWAPEAYEGAPSPISAFLSSASKAAGFVVAFRVFLTAFPVGADIGVDWVLAFQVLAFVTMFVGNFAAATQENVKRMMAYSSIGHAGYVLIALGALTGVGDNQLILGAGMIHLAVYGFMNTGAFLFIALAEYWSVGRTFEDYNGLGKQAPVACAAMTVFLFSLAGLPIGGGFLSKFFLLYAAIDGGVLLLAAALIINSALSLYYYTRVVRAMWLEERSTPVAIDGYPTGLYTAIVVAAVVTFALLPGLFFFSDLAFEAAGTFV